MKKHARAVFLCAAVLVLAILAWLFPGSQEINVTLPAAEYRLDDPDYVVEHTVTLRGRDTRNRLGHGTFQGTISVSGPADREAAFSMARKLTRGTRLASCFEET